MGTERSSRPWKRVAVAALLVAVGSLAALVAVLVLPNRATRMTDDRLTGTWLSDADRTIAGIGEWRPLDGTQEAALRQLFGKMRVTYTATTYTTELDGATETHAYEVLGKDKHSVAIREVGRQPQALDEFVQLSEFTVINFDGPDSYWLHTQIGGIREFFRRVR